MTGGAVGVGVPEDVLLVVDDAGVLVVEAAEVVEGRVTVSEV